jgi:hypothetical protein
MRIAMIVAAVSAVLLLAPGERAAVAHGGGFGGFGGMHFGGRFGHFGRFGHGRFGRFSHGRFFNTGSVILPSYGTSSPDSNQAPIVCQETVTVQSEHGGTTRITITRC